METLTATTLSVARSMPASSVTTSTPASLHYLIKSVIQSLAPNASHSKSAIINDIPEDLFVSANKELVASVLSNLMYLVITNTKDSRIRITAKLFGNVVLVHVKDDGCLNYDSISQKLTKMQTLAERLGGFVGFTSYRNKLTTIAFSFMNVMAEAA
jgi:C4-dicarboxylate-specific signal transduction histidine kinase